MRRGCAPSPENFLHFLYQNGEILCIPGDIYWHCNCINDMFWTYVFFSKRVPQSKGRVSGHPGYPPLDPPLNEAFISLISTHLISPHLASSHVTQFHLNGVRCDWSQSSGLGSDAMRSCEMRPDRMRWDEMCDMNAPQCWSDLFAVSWSGGCASEW